MKFLSIRHAVPSRVLTNDEVISRVLSLVADTMPSSDSHLVKPTVVEFIERAGTSTRHLLAPGETAADVLRSAIDGALGAANVGAEDLDFIIYAGVHRGWLEPSMAAFVQREIGATAASCFDVSEACASWMRAVQIAQAFLSSKTYRTGLIVNCECASEHLVPTELKSLEDLRRALAVSTIGEAATATVVTSDLDSDVYVVLRSFGKHLDLCMIPFENAGSFLTSFDATKSEPNKFYSQSDKLFQVTINHLWDVYNDDLVLTGRRHDLYFPHAASAKAGFIARKRLGISAAQWRCTHAKYGNTVAASVPLGMSVAIDDGVLSRGSKLLAIVGSAGVSVGFLSFTF